MTEEEKNNILFLAELFIGDQQTAEIWFNSYNKSFKKKPIDEDYKTVKEYLLHFIYH